MAVEYPSYLAQCDGSDRVEVTSLITDVSYNGVTRARCMHREPTYRLTLVHDEVTMEDFAAFDYWWSLNFYQRIVVQWAVDKERYVGVPESPPTVAPGEMHDRVNIALTLLVKKEGAVVP